MNNTRFNKRGRGWNNNRGYGNRREFGDGKISRSDPFKKWNRYNPRGAKLNTNRNDYKDTSGSRQNILGPGERLPEVEIGVTEYVSTLKGISGIIKSRYSDFHVNEIGLDGEVAILNDQTVPTLDDANPATDDIDFANKYNVELLPAETWDKLDNLSITKDENPEKVEIDVTGMTKEERTVIYDSVKKVFGNSINGSTLNRDEKKVVVFSKYNKGDRIDKRERWTWPGLFVHFLVHKENITTLEAASNIADALYMSYLLPNYFGYSGTKDRRANTTQWFSLRKVQPAKINSACKRFKNIHVGNFKFSQDNLKLGDLRGNRFRIALRNVTSTAAEIEVGMESLAEKGFINYYGLQRFGNNRETPTYLIGMKLLQGEFQEATELILAPRPGPLFSALDLYKRTKNAELACMKIGKYQRNSIEGLVLTGLMTRKGNDYMAVLFKIPRSARTLYMHSYQSLIWNKCVSERIKKFGFEVVVGDLVLDNPIDIWERPVEDLDIESTCEEPELLETTCSESTKESEDIEKPKIKVKVVTEEDVLLNKFSIFDIVLPLPGYSVEYPPNLKELYEQLLKNDKLDLDLKQKSKSFSLSGAYRHMVTRPKDIEWKCVKYSDPYGDLIASDLKDMMGEKVKGIDESGKFQALIMEFSLSACSYATMVLRELLKTDTSSEKQALANDYHKVCDKSEAVTVTPEESSIITLPEPQTASPEIVVEANEENLQKRKIGNGDADEQLEDDNKKIKLN